MGREGEGIKGGGGREVGLTSVSWFVLKMTSEVMLISGVSIMSVRQDGFPVPTYT